MGLVGSVRAANYVYPQVPANEALPGFLELRRSRRLIWQACARAFPASLRGNRRSVSTLEVLNRELGMKRLLLEGGINGTLSARGSGRRTAPDPVPGAKGPPSIFDSAEIEVEQRAPVTPMILESSDVLKAVRCWRYRL